MEDVCYLCGGLSNCDCWQYYCKHILDKRKNECIACMPDAAEWCVFWCVECDAGTWHNPIGECARCKHKSVAV